jgi:hypothetical protein
MDRLKRLGPLLLAGAADVGAVWGLFSSILKDLVPPVGDAQQVTNMVSMIALLILVALVLAMPRNPPPKVRRALGVLGTGAVLISLVLFLMYRDRIETYVYAYPPGEVTIGGQRQYVRGEYHQKGAQRAANSTTAAAVEANGGPDVVNNKEILWTRSSRKAIEQRLVIWYAAVVSTICTTLFSLAIPLLSSNGQKG